MVNFLGPVDEPILNDIKSNNEKTKSKKESNIKEKTKTYNEIIFVQAEKDNILIEYSKLKKLEEKLNSNKVTKRGRVIFMQHGLDGVATGDKQHIEFQVMSAYLTRKGLTGSNGYGYVSLGIVTKREKTIKDLEEKNIPKIKKGKTALFLNNNKYNDKTYYENIHTNSDGSKTTYGLQQFINELTLSNNVLIRNEFSKGTLSFSEQLQQYTEIVELFGNFEADVTFIGHSMGGLSSINYSVDYHKKTKKNIDVITISTPYDNNNFAKASTLAGNIADFAIQSLNNIFNTNFENKELNSPAHKELSGKDGDIARSKLENKWNKYDGNIDLISIGIDGFKILGDGDGIVSLKSQLNLKNNGSEVYKNSIKILVNLLDNKTKIGYEFQDNNLYEKILLPEKFFDWHSQTPDLKDVIEITSKLIIK